MGNSLKYSERDLRELYWDRQLTIRKMAAKLSTNPSNILYYMNKFRIPRRKTAILIGPNKSQLFNFYWNEGLSEREIANKLNCDLSKIARRMRVFNIPRRNPNNQFKITKKQLFDLYWNKKLVPSKIAKIFGCEKAIIYDWLRKFKISVRNASEAAIQRFKNPKNHPWYGRQHTEEARTKMSKKHKGIKLSEDWKRKIKESCQGINKGKNNGNFGKSPRHGWHIKYRNTWMRSSYEIAYAKYLDRNNIKWKYESKMFDLGETTYRPDFYLLKEDLYVEIKGYWRDNAKKKFKLFRQLYPEIKIKVLMKPELQELGVL